MPGAVCSTKALATRGTRPAGIRCDTSKRAATGRRSRYFGKGLPRFVLGNLGQFLPRPDRRRHRRPPTSRSSRASRPATWSHEVLGLPEHGRFRVDGQNEMEQSVVRIAGVGGELRPLGNRSELAVLGAGDQRHDGQVGRQPVLAGATAAARSDRRPNSSSADSRRATSDRPRPRPASPWSSAIRRSAS